MSTVRTRFTFVNNLPPGSPVEFLVQHGPAEFSRITVDPGASAFHATDPAAGFWHVFARVGTRQTYPPELTKDPNATFVCQIEPATGHHVVTMSSTESDAGGPDHVEHERAHHRSLHAVGDLAGLERAAIEVGQRFHAQPVGADVPLLRDLCHLIGSFDLGDWEGQARIVDGLALAALTHPECLSEDDELELLCHLADPTGSTPGEASEDTRLRVGLWLGAWARIVRGMDPDFDRADRPLLNVPAPAGLPAGVALEAVTDPRHRAEYFAAIQANRAKADHRRQQIALERLARRLWPLLESYVTRAAVTPRFYDGAVREVLTAHLTHVDDEGRTALVALIDGAVASAGAGVTPQVLPATRAVVVPENDFHGRRRDHFGVGEWVHLSLEARPELHASAMGDLKWFISQGRGRLLQGRGGRAIYRFSGGEEIARLTLKVADGVHRGETLASVELVGVPLTGALMTRAAGTALSHTTNTFSVGFTGTISLLPANVSHDDVLFREGGVASIATGWLSTWNNIQHAVGDSCTITGNVVDGADEVDSGTKMPPPPYAVGDFCWPIPWQYSADNGATWTSFTTATHHATSSATGEASIEKAGAGPFTQIPSDPTVDGDTQLVRRLRDEPRMSAKGINGRSVRWT